MKLSSVAKQFSRAANAYHLEADLQRRIAQQLCFRISNHLNPQRILELGCGTGFLTACVCERFPSAKIVALDISEKMLSSAQLVLNGYENIDFVQGDGVKLNFPACFDLLISSSALHWMDPYGEMFLGVKDALVPGGKVFASAMIEGTLAELHCLRAELPGPGPVRKRLPSGEMLLRAAAEAGLEILEYSEQQEILWYSSATEMLRQIKRLGLTGGEISRGARILTRGELLWLRKEYERRFQDELAGVPATFKVASFVLSKPL